MTVFLRQRKPSEVSGWLRHTSPLLSAAPAPQKVHSQTKRSSHPINAAQCGPILPSAWGLREGKRDPGPVLPNLRQQHALANSIASEHASNLQIRTAGESAPAVLQHQTREVLPRTLKHARARSPQPMARASHSPRTPCFPLFTPRRLPCPPPRGTRPPPLHLPRGAPFLPDCPLHTHTGLTLTFPPLVLSSVYYSRQYSRTQVVLQ